MNGGVWFTNRASRKILARHELTCAVYFTSKLMEKHVLQVNFSGVPLRGVYKGGGWSQLREPSRISGRLQLTYVVHFPSKQIQNHVLHVNYCGSSSHGRLNWSKTTSYTSIIAGAPFGGVPTGANPGLHVNYIVGVPLGRAAPVEMPREAKRDSKNN